jgi:hypothetical protein
MKPARLLTSAVLATLALGTVSARAETFQGWRYTPLEGFRVEETGDRVTLTHHAGRTFCTLSLFAARRSEKSAAAESSLDWYNVVERNFAKIAVVRRGSLRTKNGIDVTSAAAAATDNVGARYGVTHYGFALGDVTGSALLISDSPGTLARCERLARKFVDNVSVDWSSPLLVDPEARLETPVGRWSTTAVVSVRIPRGVLRGPINREYTFEADGTYRFKSTHVGESEAMQTIEERGTYATNGNQLTLTPTSATSTMVLRGAAKPAGKIKLEPTTYSFRKLYQLGTNRWQLELRPLRATVRDGQLSDGVYRYAARDLDFPNS